MSVKKAFQAHNICLDNHVDFLNFINGHINCFLTNIPFDYNKNYYNKYKCNINIMHKITYLPVHVKKRINKKI